MSRHNRERKMLAKLGLRHGGAEECIYGSAWPARMRFDHWKEHYRCQTNLEGTSLRTAIATQKPLFARAEKLRREAAVKLALDKKKRRQEADRLRKEMERRRMSGYQRVVAKP